MDTPTREETRIRNLGVRLVLARHQVAGLAREPGGETAAAGWASKAAAITAELAGLVTDQRAA
jgi:hypothetical protein